MLPQVVLCLFVCFLFDIVLCFYQVVAVNFDNSIMKQQRSDGESVKQHLNGNGTAMKDNEAAMKQR